MVEQQTASIFRVDAEEKLAEKKLESTALHLILSVLTDTTIRSSEAPEHWNQPARYYSS
jgi:hypothetical protein